MYYDVMEGDILYAPENADGNTANISWAMLCEGDEPPYYS